MVKVKNFELAFINYMRTPAISIYRLVGIPAAMHYLKSRYINRTISKVDVDVPYKNTSCFILKH